MSSVICPYCQQQALFPASMVYKKKALHGWYWVCEPCNARVGCHRDSDRPLGTLANAELRQLRRKCHAQFDWFWQQGFATRPDAYAWLAAVLGPEKGHIAWLNEQGCHELLELTADLRKTMKAVWDNWPRKGTVKAPRPSRGCL